MQDDQRLYINGVGQPPPHRVFQLLNSLSLDREPRVVQQAAINQWLEMNAPSPRMLESLLSGGWISSPAS